MELPNYEPIVEPTYDPYRVLWLRNGYRVHRCVWELIYRCEKHGVRFDLEGGEVIPRCEKPGMVTEKLIEDVRMFETGIVWILQNTPGDAPGRPF